MKEFRSKKKITKIAAAFLCAVMLFSIIGVRGIDVSAAQGFKYEGLKLIPGGTPFGVRFNTVGVLVVGFCDIDAKKGTENPAYTAGLRANDVITKANGEILSDAGQLTKIVENSDGKSICLTYTRGGEEKTATLTPIYSVSEKRYKTGIWVRDSGAGIGTVTYVFPKTYAFGGLGHGICDGETGKLIPMQRGSVTDVTISAIKRGVSGTPGEIKGYFGNNKLGTLIDNTECGVYGLFTEKPKGTGEAMDIASRHEVKNGDAYILCTLDGGGVCKYSVEITGINRDAKGSKCFTVKISDKALIEKTGGIIQGMSGSPIIQNGKLIGAVTHVLINDPTTGYGIFIENMLENMPSLLK